MVTRRLPQLALFSRPAMAALVTAYLQPTSQPATAIALPRAPVR